MGIEVGYQRIKPDELMDLQLHPDKADAFFGWDLDLDDDEVLDNYVNALESDNRYFTLDSWWRQIYFLLNGEHYGDLDQDNMDSPFRTVIAGGTAMEIIASFGFIRYFRPCEVIKISNALNKIPMDQVHLRLNTMLSKRKVDSHLSCDIEEYRENYKRLLLDLYNKLTSFFDEAVKQGEVILVYFE